MDDTTWSVRQRRRRGYCLPPADILIWNVLQENPLPRVRFRRQVVIGEYLVDLYCASARIAVDLDAPAPGTENGEDLIRTAELSKLGILLLRYSAGSAGRCPAKVGREILECCLRRMNASGIANR